MSDRPRSNFLAIGLALVAAFTIGALLYFDAVGWQRLYERDAANYGEYYRNTAKIRAREACARRPREEIRACVREHFDAARENEHNEYDLQAQLVTSAWTRAMGIAAIIGMAVGIFGVGLVYKTFEETRNTAKAAQDALDHDRKVFAAQVRPRMTITQLTVRDTNLENEGRDVSLKIQFRVRNEGTAHAKNVRAYYRLYNNTVGRTPESFLAIHKEAVDSPSVTESFPYITTGEPQQIFKWSQHSVADILEMPGTIGLYVGISYEMEGDPTTRETTEIWEIGKGQSPTPGARKGPSPINAGDLDTRAGGRPAILETERIQAVRLT